MKLSGIELKIARILESDSSEQLKVLKLQNLALRTFPSSPNQKAVLSAIKTLVNSTVER